MHCSNFFRLINALSIDIALGAVFSSRLVYYALEITPEWQYDLLLGFTVWLIYSADHLMDARNIKGKATSFRHWIHQEYFRPIAVLGALVLGLCLYVSMNFLSFEEFSAGIALLGFVVLHQYLNLGLKRLHFLFGKEIRIVLGYSLGISLIPLVNSRQISSEIFLLIFCLFLIALANLLFFGMFEKDADRKDNLKGIGVHWKKENIKKTANYSMIFCLIGCLIYFFLYPASIIPVVLLSMLVILMLAFQIESRVSHSDIYRSIGDGVFLMPAVLFLL